MSDIENAFIAVCDELGCAYDNESPLIAIDNLRQRAGLTRSEVQSDALADELTAHFHRAIFSRETQALVDRVIEALRPVVQTSEVQSARVPKVRTSHHRNKEEAARLQALVDKRFAADTSESEPARTMAAVEDPGSVPAGYNNGSDPGPRTIAQASWQPIATCPHSEAILVRGGGLLYPIVANWSGRSDESWWLDGEGDVHAELDHIPTHWMPLDALEALAVPSASLGGGK